MLFAHCAHTLRVRDVIALPPPQNVQASRQQDFVTVTWQAPAGGGKVDFRGYFLYHAPRSLAALPLEQMPRPVEIAPGLVQFTFALADSLPVFIHLRSREGGRYVSLPSLPEVVVPAAVASSEAGQ